MFAYCNNNPVGYFDPDGENAESVLELWTIGMSWLPFVDFALPVTDLLYIGGILLLSGYALIQNQDSSSTIDFDVANDSYSSPSPNNDDDDDDDDDNYYDDDSNFGGRQKMGNNKGNTPRNNQAQNKQFKDATKGRLNKSQQQKVHKEISGKGLGFHDIVDIVNELFPGHFGTGNK